MFFNLFGKRAGSKKADFQNDLIRRHYAEVENIYREMRGWRHDYHNHLQAIKAYIATGQIDALSEFCNRLEEDLQGVDWLVKTGNVMLDAVLNSKLSLARHRCIETHVTAAVPSSLSITDVDLCVLMGNLLDNAMEACMHPRDADWEFDRPFIRVYVGMKGHHLYICVTNTVYGAAAVSTGNRFASTKSAPGHGFGLARIEKICARYGGYCKRGREPGAFSMEILLPVGATGTNNTGV